MKMTLAALLLVWSVLPALAQSEAPASRVHDYTFVDVVYVYQDIDIGIEDMREDAHGLGVAGGVQLHDWFSLWASSSVLAMEMEYVNVTTTLIGVGMGVQTRVTESVSAYATVGYLSAEVEAEWAVDRDVSASVTTDGNGDSVGAGLRASVLPRFDLSVGVSLAAIEDESDTSLGAGLDYRLTDKVALGVGLSVADDVMGAVVGTRFYLQ